MRILLLPLLAAPLLAQTADPISQALRGRYEAVRTNLIEAADLMPEEHYGFRLTTAQRPWGEWIGHSATAMESNCAAMQGKSTPPVDHSAHASASGKANMTQMLRAAAMTCDAAFTAMTDARLAAPVGERKVIPANAAISLIATLNSHYGNMVGYLRTKNLVPPSTARAAKR